MGRRNGERARRKALGLDSLQAYAATPERRLTQATIYASIMQRRDTARVVQMLRCEANRLEAELRGLRIDQETYDESSGIAVTDHAVVRFFERVMGLDIEAVREQIARIVPEAKMPAFGSHAVATIEGFHFLLSNKSVISVLSPGMDFEKFLASREDQ